MSERSWKIIRRERPDSSVYPYPRPDRTTLGPGEIEATGIGELVTTPLMLFMFWIFGKREVSYPGLTTARALDNPKRDRLELLARTYMTDRDVKQTVADLSKTVEYMSVIQAANDA